MQPVTFEEEIHFAVNSFFSFIDNLETDSDTFFTQRQKAMNTHWHLAVVCLCEKETVSCDAGRVLDILDGLDQKL